MKLRLEAARSRGAPVRCALEGNRGRGLGHPVAGAHAGCEQRLVLRRSGDTGVSGCWGVFGISLIGQLFIDAALLGLLIFIFARYNATNDLFNRIAVVAGVSIGTMVMAGLWAESLGLWLLVPQMLLTGGLLIWLVGTNPVQAAIITVLFLGIKVAMRFALAYVLSGA